MHLTWVSACSVMVVSCLAGDPSSGIHSDGIWRAHIRQNIVAWSRVAGGLITHLHCHNSAAQLLQIEETALNSLRHNKYLATWIR